MTIATTAKLCSKDPSTQVGACIVSPNNRILSIGYNGAPNGFSDDIFPWNREGDFLDTKYPFVVHAERNAILNFRGSLREMSGGTVYVTLFPCNECAKEIAQVGISKIVYHSMPKVVTQETLASIKLLETVGVEIESFGDLRENSKQLLSSTIDEFLKSEG